MTYEIEKPEKGAGIAEYLVKYITLSVLFLIGFWSLCMLIFVQFSNVGLTSNIYTISFVVSMVLTIAVLVLLLSRLIQKIKQGILYKIEFLKQDKILRLYLYNDFKGFDIVENIPYEKIILTEKPQKIEIKSELKINIFNQNKLINSLNIAKTPWTVHPKIVEIVDEIRLLNMQ